MGGYQSAQVTDQSLKHTLEFGIGIHHAGLPERDRKARRSSQTCQTLRVQSKNYRVFRDSIS